jgi:outer membrane receptor protein involved in Fe transport
MPEVLIGKGPGIYNKVYIIVCFGLEMLIFNMWKSLVISILKLTSILTTMLKKLLKVSCLLLLAVGQQRPLLAQTPLTVAGKVTDAKTNEGLTGVNIHVKGKVIGTTTDRQGNYTLTTTTEPPLTLIFSFIGFETKEQNVTASQSGLNIALAERALMGAEIVVTASRVEENIMRSPVSIEKMDLLAIRETPAANFYDAVQNLKSVDMVTSSMGFKVINTRGFMSTNNPRFVQLIDGIDNQAPGLGIPTGNMVGLPDLDAQSVEIVPGASSALYGPNAFNGVISMTSKNPFEHPGLSAMARVGVNHLNSPDADAHPLYEGQVRYAQAFRNKFAFKVNLSYMKALDWYASSAENVDLFTRPTLGNDPNNPAYNGLNYYGDDLALSVPIGPGGAPVRVTRTAYAERYLVDYNTFSLKGDAALHYRLTEGIEGIYQYKYGQGTTIYQGSNRYAFKAFVIQQHKAELRGADFFLRSYYIQENSGDTYDSRFLAQNLNRSWKSDQQWVEDYGAAYRGAYASQGFPGESHADARRYADQGRLLPGTPAFESEKDRLAAISDFRVGAKFNDQTEMSHTEGQYDLSRWTKDFLDVQVGGNYRLYDLNSKGTLFSDTTGNDITIYEYGAYVQTSKSLFHNSFKLTTSLRFDKNENFEGRLTPRISAVLTLGENHNFRASFQTGFRNPSVQDQFIFLDVGQAKLVGGVPATSRGLHLYGPEANVYTLSSVQAFGGRVAADIAAGTTASRAVLNNAALLQAARVDYVKPEQNRAYEIGYKGLGLDKSLMWDVNYYYSTYNNFILNTTVLQPESNIRDDPAGGAFDVASSRFQPYQLYTNADEEVSAQGASLGLSYSLPRGFTIGGNTNWNKLQLKEGSESDQIPAFNTPEWKFNLTAGNRNVYRHVGFNAAYRWSSRYVWQSNFIPGIKDARIPAFGTLDAQVSYKAGRLKSIFKLGGSNILNNWYRQVYGGPDVGAIYYVSVTFDELLK